MSFPLCSGVSPDRALSAACRKVHSLSGEGGACHRRRRMLCFRWENVQALCTAAAWALGSASAAGSVRASVTARGSQSNRPPPATGRLPRLLCLPACERAGVSACGHMTTPQVPPLVPCASSASVQSRLAARRMHSLPPVDDARTSALLPVLLPKPHRTAAARRRRRRRRYLCCVRLVCPIHHSPHLTSEHLTSPLNTMLARTALARSAPVARSVRAPPPLPSPADRADPRPPSGAATRRGPASPRPGTRRSTRTARTLVSGERERCVSSVAPTRRPVLG